MTFSPLRASPAPVTDIDVENAGRIQEKPLRPSGRSPPSVQKTAEGAYDNGIAAIVSAESPLAGGRTLVALLSEGASGAARLNAELVNPAGLGSVTGSVAVVNAAGVTGFDVGEHYTVGNLPWYHKVWMTVIDRPGVLVAAALLSALFRGLRHLPLHALLDQEPLVMFKKMIISAALACAFCSASSAMAAWPVWDEFRNDALDNGRVVDKSDDRKVTTSEGQSYAMFFALVTNDQVTFDGLAAWTADNLSGGDLTKTLPAWLWGRGRGDKWGILDTNNATDSDMWIAWCFLEAGRLWKSEEYTKKGMTMLELLKKEVRTVDNLGSVVLPGRVGFEDNGTVKLNPSYYPLFLFKRFALEDAYWNEVYEGSLRMLLRSSPRASPPTGRSLTRAAV